MKKSGRRMRDRGITAELREVFATVPPLAKEMVAILRTINGDRCANESILGFAAINAKRQELRRSWYRYYLIAR